MNERELIELHVTGDNDVVCPIATSTTVKTTRPYIGGRQLPAWETDTGAARRKMSRWTESFSS